jgi:hypothetical protein
MLIYALAYSHKGDRDAVALALAIGDWQRNRDINPVDAHIDSAAVAWSNGDENAPYRIGTAFYMMALAAGVEPDTLYKNALTRKGRYSFDLAPFDMRDADYYEVALKIGNYLKEKMEAGASTT